MNLDKLVQGVKSAFSSEGEADLLGRGLGIFSVALGVTKVVAPEMLAKTIGVDPRGAGPAIIARSVRASSATESRCCCGQTSPSRCGRASLAMRWT